MMIRLSIPLAFALLACAPAPPDSAPAPAPVRLSLQGIETAPDGRCFARTTGPTTTRVITDVVEVEPALKDRNGVVIRPAIFRNVTRPVTEALGEGALFETVCPQVYTADFVASLQRALIVRRAYGGGVTGTYDQITREAVQAFQREMDVDSPLLSIRTARALGLVAVPR